MQGNGVPVLGIYLDDDTNDMGFRNVLIEGNVMHNGNAQGLRMEDVVGLVVRNNTMLQSSGDAFDAPKILLADGTRNVLIDGNIYAGVVGPALQNLSGNNISIVNNIVVQIHNPLAADYVGNLFINAMADLPTLADLRPIPGSMADGYGSDLGDISAARQPFDGFVNESRGSGLALSTHLFNVLDGDNTDGNNIPVNAIVRWDFGDGTKALGAAVSHTFGAAGSYVTKATVTLPSGQVYTIAKTVEVVTPVAVHSTFDKGLLDSSDLPQQVTAIGQMSLIQSDFGQSVKLGGPKSAVKFGATAEVLDNPEFTISLAFKKNAGAEAAGGRIFYFSGTAGRLPTSPTYRLVSLGQAMALTVPNSLGSLPAL